MLKLAVVANKKDNVATTVKDLKKNQEILVDIFGDEKTIKLREDVPFGHKFAICDIKKGNEIVKYGEEIGEATEDITIGEYVHVHNIVSQRGRGDLEVQK